MPTGSCICGKLKYEYETAAMKVICHCITCRKVSGSTFLTALLVPEQSLKLNAEPGHVTDATHEVGMKIRFYGCDNCPSTIYKTADGFPGLKIVLAGTLDDHGIAEEGKPEGELWVKYRVPWLAPLEGCQQFEGFPEAN